jgi:hypothetical protein
MQPLITRAEIARYKQVSKTPNDAKLNEQILDAQMLDVAPLLGENLYNKIMATPEEYTELLEGGAYSHDGVSYNNYGLKMVLCYFAYARYIMFGSEVDTPSGFKEKLSNESRPVEFGNKKTIYSLNRDSAMMIWDNVNNYLTRTGQNQFNHCQPKQSQGIKFFKIG